MIVNSNEQKWTSTINEKADTLPIKEEKVNHPQHYNNGGIECIDALAAATEGLQGIESFCTANAIKYLWRWKWKNGAEDLEKAIWYIKYLKNTLVNSN